MVSPPLSTKQAHIAQPWKLDSDDGIHGGLAKPSLHIAIKTLSQTCARLGPQPGLDLKKKQSRNQLMYQYQNEF